MSVESERQFTAEVLESPTAFRRTGHAFWHVLLECSSRQA